MARGGSTGERAPRTRLLLVGLETILLAAVVACATAVPSRAPTEPPPAEVTTAPVVQVPGPPPDAPDSLVEARAMTVVRRPISQVGLEIGREYRYEMGHCGLDMPIDVDGSFWLPVEPTTKGRFEQVEGIWRLEDHWVATFTTPAGWTVELRRQPGNLEFRLCA